MIADHTVKLAVTGDRRTNIEGSRNSAFGRRRDARDAVRSSAQKSLVSRIMSVVFAFAG